MENKYISQFVSFLFLVSLISTHPISIFHSKNAFEKRSTLSTEAKMVQVLSESKEFKAFNSTSSRVNDTKIHERFNHNISQHDLSKFNQTANIFNLESRSNSVQTNLSCSYMPKDFSQVIFDDIGDLFYLALVFMLMLWLLFACIIIKDQQKMIIKQEGLIEKEEKIIEKLMIELVNEKTQSAISINIIY